MDQSYTRIKANKLLKVCNRNIKSILKHRNQQDEKFIKNYIETVNNKRSLLNKFGFNFKMINKDIAIKKITQTPLCGYPDMSYSTALVVAYRIKVLAKESSEKSGMITVTAEDCVWLFPS